MEQLLQDLQDEYTADSTWTIKTIDESSSTIALKISKWHNKWFSFKREFDKLSLELDQTYVKKYVYYKKDFDIKLSATEIKEFISGDADYLNTKTKLKQAQAILEYIEKAIKNLDGVRWDIKNTIEWEKFKSGV